MHEKFLRFLFNETLRPEISLLFLFFLTIEQREVNSGLHPLSSLGAQTEKIHSKFIKTLKVYLPSSRLCRQFF